MKGFAGLFRCIFLVILFRATETRFFGRSKPNANAKYIVKSKKLDFKIRPTSKLFARPNATEELYTSMLPWQVSLFLKFFEPESDSSEIQLNNQPEGPAAAFLNAGMKFLSTFYERLQAWVFRNKKSFQLAGKASGFAFVGFLILRRLGNWYKGMAEYELLLDSTDYEYQAYGGCFNGIGGSLMASLNHTAVSEYKYTQLVRSLVSALDVPCFPQTMTNFAIETGKDVAVLLGDFDVRLRDWKRRNKHLSHTAFGFSTYYAPVSPHSSSIPSNFTTISGSFPVTEQQEQGADSSSDIDATITSDTNSNINNTTRIPTAAASVSLMDLHSLNELLVLRGIQHGVAVLQVRQADACLRIARLQILHAANTIEDLLTQWRGRVASRSQTLRLPLPRILMSRIPGLKRGLRAKPLQGIRKALNMFKFAGDDGKSSPHGTGTTTTSPESTTGWSMAYWTHRGPPTNISTSNANGFSNSSSTIVGAPTTTTTTTDGSTSGTMKINTTSSSTSSAAKSTTTSLSGGARNELSDDDQEEEEEEEEEDGDEAESESVEDILRDLNSREKVLLLEGMQHGLYDIAGKIQTHLYALEGIRGRLIEESNHFHTSSSSSSSTSGGTANRFPSSPRPVLNDDRLGTGNGEDAGPSSAAASPIVAPTGLLSDAAERVWIEVDDWISQAGEICTTSMSLVMMQDRARREATLAARAMEGVYTKQGAAGKRRRERENEREKERRREQIMDETKQSSIQIAAEVAANQAAKVGAAVEDFSEAAALTVGAAVEDFRDAAVSTVGAAVEDFRGAVVRVIDDRRRGILRKFHSQEAERYEANASGSAGRSSGDDDQDLVAFSAAGCSPEQFANVCTASLDTNDDDSNDGGTVVQGSGEGPPQGGRRPSSSATTTTTSSTSTKVTTIGSFVLHAGLGDILEQCFVKGDVFSRAIEQVGDTMEWSSCWSAVGVEGGEFGEKTAEDPSTKRRDDSSSPPPGGVLSLLSSSSLSSEGGGSEGAASGGLELVVDDQRSNLIKEECSPVASGTQYFPSSPSSSPHQTTPAAASYYSSIYSRATSRVLMKSFGTAYNFLLHGSESAHDIQYSSSSRGRRSTKTRGAGNTGASAAAGAVEQGEGKKQGGGWGGIFSWGNSDNDTPADQEEDLSANNSSSSLVADALQDPRLPFLWTRQLKYTHNRAGGLFSGPTSTRHTLVQVLNTRKVVLNNADHPDHNVSSSSSSPSLSSGCTGRATVLGFMNLSHVQFCQGCSYTTRWVLTDISTPTSAQSEHSSGHSSSSHDSHDSHGHDHDHVHRVSSSPTTTQVSVYLDTKCPPSLYQKFITSGIKAELRALINAWHRCATAKLTDPSSGSTWTEQHTLKSHGDLLLLRAVGKEDSSHGDDGDNLDLSDSDDHQNILGRGGDEIEDGDEGPLYTNADSLAVAERLTTLEDVVDSFAYNQEGGRGDDDSEQEQGGNKITRKKKVVGKGIKGKDNKDNKGTDRRKKVVSHRDRSAGDRIGGFADEEEDHGHGFSTAAHQYDDDQLLDPLDWELPWLSSHDQYRLYPSPSQSSSPTNEGGSSSEHTLWSTNSLTTFDAMDLKLQRLRSHWRLSATVLKSLAKAPHIFQDHLAAIGLSRRRRKGIFSILRLRTLLKLTFWSGLTLAAVEAAKRSGDIAAAAELAKRNAGDFIQRRLTTPTVSIVNDVILNKRISITDKEALIDARRSLSVMLNDFLVQHRPKMSEVERRRKVQQLDMRPVSEEYELELRRPLRNLIAGQIAKLVFIQLQFVKKELLEAMQAIDELFNANQVNLQLLAVTPAVLSLLLAQAVSKSIFNAVKSSSRGRLLESSSVVHRDLRGAIRLLEKLLSMSPNNPSGFLSQIELGNLMAILHRIHNMLVLNAAHFDNLSLHQMQEDLRDLSEGRLNIGQRLALVERIVRSYPFLQPQRKLWS